MVVFPNAKINLGLNVINKRPDGFHNIETVFYPVGLQDILEVVVAHDGIFSFHSSGLTIPGDPNTNLCVKAYQLISKFTHIPQVSVHLHKVIPMGAGLGGGSADGAFMIKLLNDMFSLGFAENQMVEYAAELGSDCSFFIRNHVAFGEEKGDILTPVNIDLSAYKIVIVVPEIHVNTRDAYKWMDENKKDNTNHHPFNQHRNIPLETWKEELVNDFEIPVLSRHPEIRKIKELLYSKGAIYSSMTGSGAAVYGIFTDSPVDMSDFKNLFLWIGYEFYL